MHTRVNFIDRWGFSEQAEDIAKKPAISLLTDLEISAPDLLLSKVSNLSVGQQQRVAAARALMGAPELVIADEPTSALDSELRHGFIRLLFEECAREGATLLFVSHDMALAKHFDRVIEFRELNRSCAAN
jgi:putative ABC transport system ATP-binding protein